MMRKLDGWTRALLILLVSLYGALLLLPALSSSPSSAVSPAAFGVLCAWLALVARNARAPVARDYRYSVNIVGPP